jgi:hypothetical protein
MNRSMLFVIGLLLVLASTAPAQDVRYNYARGMDFSKFMTYKWLLLESAGQVAELTDEQIKSALKTELAKKGLTEVDRDDADLFIGYQVALGNEKQLTSYHGGWGYGSGWYGDGWYGYPARR